MADWFLGALLLAVTLIAYQPALDGRLLWDDNGHLTRPELRSLHGLARIWTEPGATQQYYPLVHTVFWLEHRLWGDATQGYHLVNILLHLLSALLLVRILRLLEVPGAWFIAALFALHPVMVESVAWITELKNTLSGVFFFATAFAYLKFDRERKKRLYAVSIGLFVLGLLSKSVIATLPVSLLAVFWWKRGKLQWKQDVVPLLPFFFLGIFSGLFTAYVERRDIIGWRVNEFDFSFIERCCIAGRAIWFYLGKIVFPVNLMFIYPRWNVSQGIGWQYLFPAATLVLAGVLWAVRNRWRAPLAVFLCFTATIFPVLGFFNVYPFRFSFVADHFQYLACIGPIALAAAVIGSASGFINQNIRRFIKPAIYVVLLMTLGMLTWKQSGTYTDAETLYRTTIRKNASCWMAYNNLGILLEKNGLTEEAMSCYRKALEIDPGLAEVHNNLGALSAKIGRTDEAMACYRKALEINPDYSKAHYNIGILLAKAGRMDEAIVQYRKALEINPEYFEAHNNIGFLLAKAGRMDEAVVHYRKVLEINPDYGDARYNLGNVLMQSGRINEAMACYRKVLEIDPDHVDARYNLGNALLQSGRINEAVACYRKVVEINPNYVDALNNLAAALEQKGQLTDAVLFLRRALAAAKSTGQEARVTIIEGDLEKLQRERHHE